MKSLGDYLDKGNKKINGPINKMYGIIAKANLNEIDLK